MKKLGRITADFLISGFSLSVTTLSTMNMCYRQLCSAMSPVEIEKTLAWKPVSSSFLFRDEELCSLLPFLVPERTLVFTPSDIKQAEEFLVVELDKARTLENVFFVKGAHLSKEMEFLWPIGGEYEERFKTIKLGDSLESVTTKVGRSSPANLTITYSNGQVLDEETLLFFLYNVRGSKVLIVVDRDKQIVEGVDVFYHNDHVCIINGQELVEPNLPNFSLTPHYSPRLLPSIPRVPPTEVKIEGLDDF